MNSPESIDIFALVWLNVVVKKIIILLVLMFFLVLVAWLSGYFSYFVKSRSFDFGTYDTSKLLDKWEYEEFGMNVKDGSEVYTGVYIAFVKDKLYLWGAGGIKSYGVSSLTRYIERYKCGKTADNLGSYSGKKILILNDEIKGEDQIKRRFFVGDFVVLSFADQGSYTEESDTSFSDITKVNQNSKLIVNGLAKVDIDVFKFGRRVDKCLKL